MFTGIIEAFAIVNTLTQEGDNLNIELESALARKLKIDQFSCLYLEDNQFFI